MVWVNMCAQGNELAAAEPHTRFEQATGLVSTLTDGSRGAQRGFHPYRNPST